MMKFFNFAFNWSERKQVPISITRNEMGDWLARLQFKDSAGGFVVNVFAFEPHLKTTKSAAESDDAFEARVNKAMDSACVSVRRERLTKMNGRDPRGNSVAA